MIMQGKGIIITLCCLLALLYFSSDFHAGRVLTRKINQIPLEDRAEIEAFFRLLILKEGGAYVLFGSKPMAFDAYWHRYAGNIAKPCSWYNFCESRILKNGYQTWKKYESLFPSKRFILRCYPFNEERSEICLIDRAKFIKTYEEHADDFQVVLGKKVNPQDLLQHYQMGRQTLFALLQEHEALLGILLGFGAHNAWDFYEEIQDNSAGLLARPLKRVDVYEPAFYGNPFRKLPSYKAYRFLYLPYFKADENSEESLRLRAQYEKEGKEIQEIYSHGSFLEVTLKRFCS